MARRVGLTVSVDKKVPANPSQQDPDRESFLDERCRLGITGSVAITSGRMGWWISGVVLLVSFGLALSAPPEFVQGRLDGVAARVSGYSLFVHCLVMCGLWGGAFVRKRRSQILTAVLVFLALSAAVVAGIFFLVPNVPVFLVILVLALFAWRRDELHYAWADLSMASRFFGILGLGVGLYYPHWVDPPVWRNALLFSPIGSLNCPTLLALSGLVSLTKSPRPRRLEFAIGISTLYFGTYGFFLLGVRVDLVLIACAAFLLLRLAAELRHR